MCAWVWACTTWRSSREGRILNTHLNKRIENGEELYVQLINKQFEITRIVFPVLESEHSGQSNAIEEAFDLKKKVNKTWNRQHTFTQSIVVVIIGAIVVQLRGGCIEELKRKIWEMDFQQKNEAKIPL